MDPKEPMIMCTVTGKITATVRKTLLSARDVIDILVAVPSDSHIYNIEVSQFEHAECKPGEAYNQVIVEYQKCKDVDHIQN